MNHYFSGVNNEHFYIVLDVDRAGRDLGVAPIFPAHCIIKKGRTKLMIRPLSGNQFDWEISYPYYILRTETNLLGRLHTRITL